MLQCVNFPLSQDALTGYGSWDVLRGDVSALGLDGLEGVWAGEESPPGLPKELIVGYHLVFYTDWLDFYREDYTALARKFGSLDTARAFYGGLGARTLLDYYRADLARARELGAKYVVFHVSDVSLEECYTYQWLHSDAEVIDAAAEIVNILLGDEAVPFEFLMENQWWPGFTFTNPEMTARLLEGIRCPKKGIMLDTGHLMISNTALRSQAEGAAYIQAMLDRHGELARMIRGIHLHQALSGAYVERHTGSLPPDLPEGYMERFAASYGHVLQIDRHQPWTDAAILPVLERVAPAYLTHEFSASGRRERSDTVRSQRELLMRGGTSLA